MTGVVDFIRRFLNGVPNERTKRIQVVRSEIMEQIEAEGWDWQQVEQSAKVAHTDLKNGRLPRTEKEVQDSIHTICKKYQSKGYPVEDLRDAVDAVQAKASAQQSIDQDG